MSTSTSAERTGGFVRSPVTGEGLDVSAANPLSSENPEIEITEDVIKRAPVTKWDALLVKKDKGTTTVEPDVVYKALMAMLDDEDFSLAMIAEALAYDGFDINEIRRIIWQRAGDKSTDETKIKLIAVVCTYFIVRGNSMNNPHSVAKTFGRAGETLKSLISQFGVQPLGRTIGRDTVTPARFVTAFPEVVAAIMIQNKDNNLFWTPGARSAGVSHPLFVTGSLALYADDENMSPEVATHVFFWNLHNDVAINRVGARSTGNQKAVVRLTVFERYIRVRKFTFISLNSAGLAPESMKKIKESLPEVPKVAVPEFYREAYAADEQGKRVIATGKVAIMRQLGA